MRLLLKNLAHIHMGWARAGKTQPVSTTQGFSLQDKLPVINADCTEGFSLFFLLKFGAHAVLLYIKWF